MSFKIAYQNENFEHRILGSIESTATVSTKELCDITPLIVTDEAKFADVLAFYKNNFSEVKLKVIAQSKSEALIALDAHVEVEYENTVISHNVSQENRSLDALIFANESNIDELARKAIRSLLRNFPIVSVEQAIEQVVSRSVLCEAIRNKLLSYAENIIEKLKRRVLSTNELNTPGAIEMSDVTADAELILSKQGVYINKAGTGTGKSKLVNEIVKQAIAQDKKVVIISHRRSINNSMLNDIADVTNYSDIKPGTEDSIKALKIVVNSIIKQNLKNWFSDVDVLIVEESAQVIRHIATGTVDKRSEVFDMLKFLTAKANTSFFADADNNKRVFKFINSSNKSASINYMTKNADLSNITIEIMSYSQAEGLIKDQLINKTLICADSKIKVEQISAKIKRSLESLKTLAVHSDNIMSKEQRSFVSNPDSEIKKIDALIYSPVITSSVSITTEHFANHVALLSGVVTPTDAIQMIRRDRTARHIKIGISNAQYSSDNVSDILINIRNPNDFDRFAASVQAEDNFLRFNNIAAFYFLAQKAGFNVVISEQNNDVEKAGLSFEASARSIESHIYKKKMLESKKVKSTKSVRSNLGENSEESSYEVERFRLLAATGEDEVTEELLKKWKRGVLSSHVSNFEILRTEKNRCKNADSLDKNKGRDKRNFVLHHEIYSLIFSSLNIDTKTGAGVFNLESANALIDVLHERRKQFNSLDLRTKLPAQKMNHGTRKVKAMLKEFGLEIDQQDTSEQFGRMRSYSINEKSFADMVKFESKRKSKNLMSVPISR